jgi:hypothetical protein
MHDHGANQIEAVHRRVETSAERADRRCGARRNHETPKPLPMTSDRNSSWAPDRTDNLSGRQSRLAPRVFNVKRCDGLAYEYVAA